MGINLEAYAVLTYANNYHCWLEEATRGSNGGGEAGGGAAEVSGVTDQTASDDGSNRSKRKYTETTRGTGKFKGWAEDGIKLYNRIEAKIDKQRDDPNLSDFDINLKTMYLTGGEGNVGATNRRGGGPSEKEEVIASNGWERELRKRTLQVGQMRLQVGQTHAA